MRYENIAETDLYASVLSMGGGSITSLDDIEGCFRLLDKYVSLGGNFVDTANVYGKWLPGGHNTSEQIIGKWMAARKNRQEIILATKGGHPDLNAMNTPRLSKAEVEKDLNESLSSLNTSHIDLYWLHRDDERIPVPEIIQYLNEFVKQGKIRYFGCSNWRVSRIKEAVDFAEKEGLQGFTGNQMMWSFAAPDPEAIEDRLLVPMDEETFKLHQETGLAAIPYSSQAKGYFEKLDRQGKKMNEAVKAVYDHDDNQTKYKRLKQLTEEHSVSLTTLSLAWMIAQSIQTFPVIGSRTIDQLESSMQAGGLELSREEVRFLETGDFFRK
ncbi:aldo/keto reductase [Sediminibacillus massiliensis]|uniref:aldo/keto reductase n=1 Tax=Sediminibacillus massiliensis TaxID=1926277 RepID=UPI000988853D|nr:aldo/keto reductase [Sediminibacillus massiliensis]